MGNEQAENLKGKAWARGMMVISHDAGGREQQMFAIDLDSLPIWLATIDEATPAAPPLRAGI